MKKLMFATALAASAAAFADPINAISFEGDTEDASVLGLNGASRTDTAETGGATPGMYFWYDGEGDSSTVKAYGGQDTLPLPGGTTPRPLFFADANVTRNNYLELSTEGGTLWRSIGTARQNEGGSPWTNGTPRAVAADGTYFDALVQFTPTEDQGPENDLTDQDKLAIWLKADSSNNTTNLMVRAALCSESVDTPTSFTITNCVVEAGKWYRLTVEAIRDISGSENIPGFRIYVDGILLKSSTPSVDPEYGSLFVSNYATDVAAGAVFVSLQGKDISSPTLEGVGFKGSGALDDIVWTEDDPLQAPALSFTLTWPAGLTAVSYSINGDAAVAITGSSPLSVPGIASGDVISFIVANADGAQKTLTGTVGTDAGIDATGETFGWKEYLGDAVNGAYTIDDANDLDMLRKGVAAGLETAGTNFNQTANINMASAGPFAGIGTYAANLNSGVAFCGTYDGQGFTISNIDFTQRNYGGVFNQVKGGTIKNLTVDTITCSTFSSSENDGEWGCSIIGNVGLGSTVQGLTAMGDFGTTAIPCSHNVAGIAIRVCGGASNVVNGVTMLETLVKDCTNNATLHGFYTKAGGITALTQDQNGVPNDYVLFDGCVNNSNIAMVEATGSTLSKIGRDGLSGILGYVADGTKIKDCVNNGTLTSALTTAKIGGIVGWAQGRELEDLGGNKNPAGQKMIGDPAGSTITGFKYATVDNGVATTTLTLAKDGEYLLEGNAAPVFAFAEAGTIAFDTALGYTLDGTGITAAEGLTLTDATSGTVTTYTAAGAGGNDYVVEIEGSDVVITPQPEDFDLMVAAAAQLDPPIQLDTNNVAAVNALLAMEIPGSGGVQAWQAAFLGVEPSTNGLKQVAIKSVSFDAEGKVVVEMADGVTLKTGRGVTINLILKGSDDLSTWTTLQTATDSKAFTPVTPAAGETKKFYKVVVEFAGSNAQN